MVALALLTKVCIVKAIVFLVVRYGCESWTVKKAECQKTDAFKLWCWKRCLRIPWTARSNQSILKEINNDYSLEGLMLKLKLQYFGHLMQRAHSLGKTLMLGKTEGTRIMGVMTEDELVGWYHRFNGHEFEQTPGDGEGQGSLAYYSPWGRTRLSDWMTSKLIQIEARLYWGWGTGAMGPKESNSFEFKMLIYSLVSVLPLAPTFNDN